MTGSKLLNNTTLHQNQVELSLAVYVPELYQNSVCQTRVPAAGSNAPEPACAV
jgi:hypothetical protein